MKVTLLVVMGTVLLCASAQAGPTVSGVHHHAHITPSATEWTSTVQIMRVRHGPTHDFALANYDRSWIFSSDDAELVFGASGAGLRLDDETTWVTFQVRQPSGEALRPPLLAYDVVQSITFDHYDDVAFEPDVNSGLQKRTTGIRSKVVSHSDARHHRRRLPHVGVAIYFRGSQFPAVLGQLESRSGLRKRALAIVIALMAILLAGGLHAYRKTSRSVQLERAEKVIREDLDDFPI